MGKLKEEEENKGRRERQQAEERRSGTKPKKTFSFCFVFCLSVERKFRAMFKLPTDLQRQS